MNTHADKTQENKSQSVSDGTSQIQGGGESTFQFMDNRPEAIAQRKLQEMVNNSQQVKQAAQLQTIADNHSARQQQPIQKKENNTGLPDNLKMGMENLSGMSLDDVKVHRNSDKPAQLQAHAYAQGTDIHLASGQEKHLPHEAWHVVQQKQGRVKPTIQMKGKVNVNDDKALESEADKMGAIAQRKISSSEQLATTETNQKASAKIQNVIQCRTVGFEIQSFNTHIYTPFTLDTSAEEWKKRSEYLDVMDVEKFAKNPMKVETNSVWLEHRRLNKTTTATDISNTLSGVKGVLQDGGNEYKPILDTEKVAGTAASDKQEYTEVSGGTANIWHRNEFFKVVNDGKCLEIVTYPVDVDDNAVFLRLLNAIRAFIVAINETPKGNYTIVTPGKSAEDSKRVVKNMAMYGLNEQSGFAGLSGKKVDSHPQATFSATLEELSGFIKEFTNSDKNWSEKPGRTETAGTRKGANFSAKKVDKELNPIARGNQVVPLPSQVIKDSKGFLTLLATIVNGMKNSKKESFSKDLTPFLPRSPLRATYQSLSREAKELVTEAALSEITDGINPTTPLFSKNNHLLNGYTIRRFIEEITAKAEPEAGNKTSLEFLFTSEAGAIGVVSGTGFVPDRRGHHTKGDLATTYNVSDAPSAGNNCLIHTLVSLAGLAPDRVAPLRATLVGEHLSVDNDFIDFGGADGRRLIELIQAESEATYTIHVHMIDHNGMLHDFAMGAGDTAVHLLWQDNHFSPLKKG